jgi:hypothetical protein
VTATYELRDDELEPLPETARTLDTVEQLQAVVADDGPTLTTGGTPRTHPALVELRQQRAALQRLLGQLALPDEDGSVSPRPHPRARRRRPRPGGPVT